MKQVLVKNIPENKLGFFMELVKNLGFSIENKPEEKKVSRKQQEFVEDLKGSLNQVEQHMNGNLKLKTADQLLDEL